MNVWFMLGGSHFVIAITTLTQVSFSRSCAMGNLAWHHAKFARDMGTPQVKVLRDSGTPVVHRLGDFAPLCSIAKPIPAN